MDDAVMLKVEIASKDLAAFTKTCPVPPEAFGPGTRGLLGPDDGFWDPHHAVHLRSGQKILANHRTLNVGIADGPKASSRSTSSITEPDHARSRPAISS